MSLPWAYHIAPTIKPSLKSYQLRGYLLILYENWESSLSTTESREAREPKQMDTIMDMVDLQDGDLGGHPSLL